MVLSDALATSRFGQFHHIQSLTIQPFGFEESMWTTEPCLGWTSNESQHKKQFTPLNSKVAAYSTENLNVIFWKLSYRKHFVPPIYPWEIPYRLWPWQTLLTIKTNKNKALLVPEKQYHFLFLCTRPYKNFIYHIRPRIVIFIPWGQYHFLFLWTVGEMR